LHASSRRIPEYQVIGSIQKMLSLKTDWSDLKRCRAFAQPSPAQPSHGGSETISGGWDQTGIPLLPGGARIFEGTRVPSERLHMQDLPPRPIVSHADKSRVPV